MLLNILGYIGLCILGIYSFFLIYIIRKRVYVQFYLSFMSLIAITSFIYIICNHINYLYSWIALIVVNVSLLAVTLFQKLKLHFINTIIRFIADIYREIILIGISKDELHTRIAQEKERIEPYLKEIKRDIEDRYKSEDKKIGELVGYTRSFVFNNIDALQKYGLENGYVPNAYIDYFKQVFLKTIQKVEAIENNYKKQLSGEIQKAYTQEQDKIKECIMEEGLQTWEEAYIRNTGGNKTRKEFLIDVDNCKDTIINNHIQSFKRIYPEIFED